MLTCTMDKGFGNMILGMFSPSSTPLPQSIPLLSWYIGAIWNWNDPSSTCQMLFRKWLLAAGGRRENILLSGSLKSPQKGFFEEIYCCWHPFGGFIPFILSHFLTLTCNAPHMISKHYCQQGFMWATSLRSTIKRSSSFTDDERESWQAKMFATPDSLVIIVIFPSLPL